MFRQVLDGFKEDIYVRSGLWCGAWNQGYIGMLGCIGLNG